MAAVLESALLHLAEVAPRSERLWPALRSLGPVLTAFPAARARLDPPAPVAERWSLDLRGTRARNVLLLSELERAFAALQNEAVPAIAFKGAATLERLYDDCGHRPMDDADVLVKPVDRGRAAAVLERLGYRARPHEMGRFGSDGPEADEWTFVGPIEIDLHWQTVADPRLRRLFPDVADPGMWVRATGSRLSRPDAALVTAVHQLLGHPWSHPLGYLDLHLELSAIDPDTRASLFARPISARLGEVLWWALRFVRELFGGRWIDEAAHLRPSTSRVRLGEALVGSDWLGLASFRREMAARDLFVLLLAGPVSALAEARAGARRGRARAALTLVRTAARALAG